MPSPLQWWYWVRGGDDNLYLIDYYHSTRILLLGNCGRRKYYFSQSIRKIGGTLKWIREFCVLILLNTTLSTEVLTYYTVDQNRASQYVCQEWIIGLPEVIIPSVLGEAKVLRAVLSLTMSRFLHGHQHAVQILSFPMCVMT